MELPKNLTYVIASYIFIAIPLLVWWFRCKARGISNRTFWISTLLIVMIWTCLTFYVYVMKG